MHPFSIASFWALLLIIGILQLCLAASPDKEIVEGTLTHGLEGLHMNESPVEFLLDSPALTHEGALNFVVSSYLQELLNDGQVISHIFSKVLHSLEEFHAMPINYSKLPFELIANKIFVDLANCHQFTPLIVRLAKYLRNVKSQLYAHIRTVELAKLDKNRVNLECVVTAIETVRVRNVQVFKAITSIFKNELISKLTSYTGGPLKDYNQVFSHFDIGILKKEMSNMNINVGLSLFSSGLMSLPVFIALDEVFGDELFSMIEANLKSNTFHSTAESIPTIHSYFFARLLRNPDPSRSTVDFLHQNLSKEHRNYSIPEVREVKRHMCRLLSFDFMLMISNMTPDLIILSANKIDRLRQQFDNFDSILVEFLDNFVSIAKASIPSDVTNCILKMGKSMAIRWSVIHQRIDPLNSERFKSLLAELDEDAIQYFPDLVCPNSFGCLTAMNIVDENIKFLGGKNSDILVKNLFHRLQDNPLELNPMGSLKWHFNTLDSLITNGCLVDNVALYLIRILKKSTESDAITSFKYALKTFVKFLSKYKHKGLLTAFVGCLEFYIHQRPREMEYDELIRLVDLQSEYQEEQYLISYLRLSKVISDYEVILRQPDVSVHNIPIHQNSKGRGFLANQYVQLLFAKDYTDAPILLLLLEKLQKFICIFDLKWESWFIYAAVHQLVHFLNHYRNVLLSDDVVDKVRGIVGQTSTSIKEYYPDISLKLDLFIKQAQ